MRAIYLDHAATTPVRPEVREAMEPFLSKRFGNPSSLHAAGRAARAALDGARRRIAEALGATASEIHFVRGGTEGNNLALLGRADACRREGRRPLVAHGAIEHPSVRDAAAAVKADGGEQLVLPLSPSGRVDPAALEEAWRGGAALVSLMWVNNETGLVAPVEEVARAGRERDVPVHSDAVQAVGKVPVRLDAVPVALATGSAHKLGGPKGVGFLFVREGTILAPRLFGGGQERGLRAGTEDVAGAIGMAEAVALAVEEREEEGARLAALRDRLEAELIAVIPDAVVHAREGVRAPHILNVGIPDVDPEALLMGLDLAGVHVSAGSACASGSVRPSPVLEALYGPGYGKAEAGAAGGGVAAIRFSLGRDTTAADVDEAARRAAGVVERARGVAPRT